MDEEWLMAEYVAGFYKTWCLYAEIFFNRVWSVSHPEDFMRAHLYIIYVNHRVIMV